MARDAFDGGNLDVAEELLDAAEKLDPSLAPEVSVARAAIVAARAVK